jgi:ribosomal protein S18 acetylase RimI-like enzyme
MLADYAELIARGCVYVLTKQQTIVGVLVMELAPDHVFVENVAILPGQQGRGLGRALLQFVEQCALEQQLPEIRLYTNELMTENLSFYRKLGFEEVERREDEGYRRVFLRKRL